MPAVGWIAKIDLTQSDFNELAQRLAAVPGLLVGDRAGSELALATWADTPEEVAEQAEQLRSVDCVVGCDLAFVDWAGEEAPAASEHLWQRNRRPHRGDAQSES